MKYCIALILFLLNGGCFAREFCNPEEIPGSWYLKLFENNSKQVGDGQIYIDESYGVSGYTNLWTTGDQFNITNSSLLPNKKCKYKLTLWMSGTTKAVLKGKMYTDKNYSKGKIKGKTNGQIWSGKYKMYKNSSTSGTTSLY